MFKHTILNENSTNEDVFGLTIAKRSGRPFITGSPVATVVGMDVHPITNKQVVVINTGNDDHTDIQRMVEMTHVYATAKFTLEEFLKLLQVNTASDGSYSMLEEYKTDSGMGIKSKSYDFHCSLSHEDAIHTLSSYLNTAPKISIKNIPLEKRIFIKDEIEDVWFCIGMDIHKCVTNSPSTPIHVLHHNGNYGVVMNPQMSVYKSNVKKG